MRYDRTSQLFVVLFLAAGIFLNSAMAQACLCGQACTQIPKNQTKAKFNFLFHLQCPGTSCKSCELEKGLKFKATGSAIKSLLTKGPVGTTINLLAHLDGPSFPSILNDFELFHVFITFPSSSIYLQKRSLRF